MVLDWLALGISGLALLVSIYAAHVARSMPEREQLRLVREELRDAVIDALRIVDDLQRDLDGGTELSHPADRLSAESKILEKHRARFPRKESFQIDRASTSIGLLYSQWVMTVQFDHQRDQAENYFRIASDSISPTGEKYPELVEPLKSRAQEASRRAESAYIRLREQIKSTQNELKDYIEQSDAVDRRITR